MKHLLMLCTLLCVSTLFAEMDTITLRFGHEYFTPEEHLAKDIPNHLRPCMMPLMLQFLPQEDIKALDQFAGETSCNRVIRRFLQYYGTKKLADRGVPSIYNDVWALLKEVAAKKQVPLEPAEISPDLLTATWQANDKTLDVNITNPYADKSLEISGKLLDYVFPLTKLKPKESVQLQWLVTNSHVIKPTQEVKNPIKTITPVFIDGKPYLFTINVPANQKIHNLYAKKSRPYNPLLISAPCKDYEQHPHLSDDELGLYFSNILVNRGKSDECKKLSICLRLNAGYSPMTFCSSEENPAQIEINGQIAGPLSFESEKIQGLTPCYPLRGKILAADGERVTLKACLILPNGRHLRVNRESIILPPGAVPH